MMQKDLSSIPWPNTLRDSNDIPSTTSEFNLPSALSSEPMDIDVEPRQSIIRSTEPDRLQARYNNSSNQNYATPKPLMKSIIRPADNDDENSSLEQNEQIFNGTLINTNNNNSISEAAGYDLGRLAEINADAEFALQLQQEEYEKDSFIPNPRSFFPFQVQEDDESSIEPLHPFFNTTEPNFENDEQYAVYLQEQERRSSQQYNNRSIPPHIQFRRQSNSESSETSATNESNTPPIQPFFNFPQRHSSNTDDDSDEDNPYRAMTYPFFQLLANQGQPLPGNLASIFPGFRARGHRRTGNLQEIEEDFGPEDYERLLQLDDTIHKKKLTEHQINTIRQEKFIPNSHNTDEENKCGVCLELFENQQTVRRFPCNHIYHKECADRWLQENNVCPICRVPPVHVSSSTNQHHHRSINNMRRPANNNRVFSNRNNNNNNNNSTAHNNNNNNNNYRRGQAPQHSLISKLINQDKNNHVSRSLKFVKTTRSRIISSISLTTMQEDHDYDEPPCPSFDLHLYAHIDHSSLNRCVFTPIPHQTVSQDEQSQQISRKRKFDSVDSASEYVKNTKFGNDNGELANIIYHMDMRLDDLTRTCNGLRSSIHTLTKMVTQLVNNQTQNIDINDFDDTSHMELPYTRSSSNVSSKSTSNRNKRIHNGTDIVSQRPTEFLCRLIRKVYSTNEIVAGINPDERLDRIKEAVADRYFPDEPERFETFWAREAHQSILGQARAQRCRDKKARNYLANNH